MKPFLWKPFGLLTMAAVLVSGQASLMNGQTSLDESKLTFPTGTPEDDEARINQVLELQRRSHRAAASKNKSTATDKPPKSAHTTQVVPKNRILVPGAKRATSAVAETENLAWDADPVAADRNPAMTPQTRSALAKSGGQRTSQNPGSSTRPGSAKLGPSASGVMQASATDETTSAVSPVAHNIVANPGVTADGADPVLIKERRKNGPVATPMVAMPVERMTGPGITGAWLQLNGETATERLLQMRQNSQELQRENEELRQQNAVLMSRLKESHEQLSTGVREIQMARKELTTARSDLERLRTDLQNLRDKVRVAEREYAAVLQSMGPLLQQLLESDDVSSLPPNPTE